MTYPIILHAQAEHTVEGQPPLQPLAIDGKPNPAFFCELLGWMFYPRNQGRRAAFACHLMSVYAAKKKKEGFDVLLCPDTLLRGLGADPNPMDRGSKSEEYYKGMAVGTVLFFLWILGQRLIPLLPARSTYRR